MQWLPALFYLANVYMRTGHTSALYLVTLFVVGIIGLVILWRINNNGKVVIYITMFIYLLSGILNCFIIGNVTLIALANDVFLFGIMVLMLVFPMDLFKGTVFFYVSISIFIYSYIMGIPAHAVLTSSGNYVSVLMILSAALYYISLSNSKRTIMINHLLPAAICFLLSIWAKGRGGILSSTVLFVLLIIYYLICHARSGSSRSLAFVIALVVAVIVYLYISNINLLETFFSLGKWSSRGIDNSSRELIWGAYFEKMKESVLYIINGAPLDQISIIHSFNNNTHNSFIQLHAHNGLIPFALFVVCMIKSLVNYINDKRFLMAIVLLSILIRGMSDKFIFGQYGMPILMYTILFPHMKSTARRRRQKRIRNNMINRKSERHEGSMFCMYNSISADWGN